MLPVSGQKKSSDYINANYIDSFKQCNAYIGTQVSISPRGEMRNGPHFLTSRVDFINPFMPSFYALPQAFTLYKGSVIFVTELNASVAVK